VNSRETVFQAELDRLQTDIGCDFCALGLLHPDSRILIWKWAVGNTNEKFRLIEDKPGRGFHRSVVKVGRAMPLQAEELIASRQLHEFPLLISEQLQSAYAVPIWQDSRVAGIMLAGDRAKRTYLPEERSRADLAGKRIAALLRETAGWFQSS
jgi:nitrogen regulatory protein A